MSKFYQTLLICCLIIGSIQVHAQRYVKIDASTDPTMITDIFPVIQGDTTDTGARVDSNTIYQLENGQVYITTGRLVNKPGWTLHIEALDLENTDSKPAIARIPNASGTYPDIMWPEGNVYIRNILIIAGDRGPLEQHDWGKIRIAGENARITIKDCIFEKDRGGFLQIRANGAKIYIDNTIFRNGGNRRILQGNGRGIDARNFYLDTLIMTQSIVHNIQDRFFRSQGGTQPHNYIEIDNCTSFNTAGRHGHIQLGRVLTAKITDNLFINPIMLGSSPFYTDEQTQPDADLHKVITVDTLYENTSLTISNNNIFWTQDVQDYWASNDTVSAPGVLSDLVLQGLGDAAASAFFQEPLTLDSIPQTILPYVVDLYDNPDAEDMFDFIVEDQALAGTAFDSGNIFAFAEFSPCYGSDAQSSTASTTGGPVGAILGCPTLATSVFTPNVNNSLALRVFPNPVTQRTNFQFELKTAGRVSLHVRDLSGRVMANPVAAYLNAGQHIQSWDLPSNLTKGLYLVTLTTEAGIMTQKLMVQ